MCHTNDIRNCTLRGDDASKSVGVLLTKLLEQHEAELAQQLILTTLLDDDREAGGEISGLLTNLGALVVKTPENSRHDLSKVGLDADAYAETGQNCARL